MQATFDSINLVATDVAKTIAFYRLLGVDVPEDAIWTTESGAHHCHVPLIAGVDIGFDSHALAAVYNAGYTAVRGGSLILGFRVETRDDVDALYERVVAAGHRGPQPPFDAFWGSRYAIVEDPDGNHVGLASPPDPDRRAAAPDL